MADIEVTVTHEVAPGSEAVIVRVYAPGYTCPDMAAVAREVKAAIRRMNLLMPMRST